MVILQLLLKKLDSIIKSREAWLNYQSVFDVLLFVFWGTLNFQLEQSLQKLSFPNHNISVYTFIYLKITERKTKMSTPLITCQFYQVWVLGIIKLECLIWISLQALFSRSRWTLQHNYVIYFHKNLFRDPCLVSK